MHMAATATVGQITTTSHFAAADSGAAPFPSTWPLPAIWTRVVPQRPCLDADNQLVARCLSGDEAAWEEMVRVHTRRVYSICYRFTGTDAEAQDLTQEVFLRVFRSIKSYRAGEGSFVVWLARLSRNLLIDHYRRTRLDRATDSIEDPASDARRKNGNAGAGRRAGSGPRGKRSAAGSFAKTLAGAARDRDPPRSRRVGLSRDRAGVACSRGHGEVEIEPRRAELASVLRRQRAL